MFKIKEKGNANTISVSEVTFKNEVKEFVVKTEKEIEMLLSSLSEEFTLEVKINGKFVPVWNLYFNEFKNCWICEGEVA